MSAGSLGVDQLAVERCRKLLEDLHYTVVEENDLLQSRALHSHAEIAARKHQFLRDLMTAQRALATSSRRSELKGAAAGLREALMANERLLKFHIVAVQEVSSIIIGCMKEAESDGTYSRRNELPSANRC